MSEKEKAPVEMALSNKGQLDGELTRYDSILSELFGQVCLTILHLNERKGEDGYGCYCLSFSDACLSAYYSDMEDHRSIFHMYRMEIESVGMLTALRSLLEQLEGEEE